jgi:dinuclear metal center YbgI/SA1388 family protein
MLERTQLLHALNDYLKPNDIKDYCPNGLQVEGNPKINKIVTGVTASQALIDKAVDLNADALLVHHGYFWKGESEVLTGMKYRRIKSLMDNNINLIVYHLPLDIHEVCGNNVQLGELLELGNVQPVYGPKPNGIVYSGQLAEPKTGQEVQRLLEQKLGRSVLWVGDENKQINSLAWCTGGGQDYIDVAIEAGIDGFISGEVSERTVHSARELDTHFFCAGHHATERYGVKALGEWLAANYEVDVQFIDIDNPA